VIPINKSKFFILIGFILAISLAVFFGLKFFGGEKVGVEVQTPPQEEALGIASDSGRVTKVIPDNYPKDLPKFSACELEAAFETEGQPNVIWTCGEEVSKVVSFYKEELPKAGWKMILAKEVEGGTTLEAQKGDLVAAIGIGKNQESGKVMVFIQVNKQTEATPTN